VTLAAPRLLAPDLPDALERVSRLGAGADVLATRVEGLAGRVEAAHATIGESAIAAATVDRMDLTGATLTDVVVADLRATELVARTGRWRTVRMTGGRVGTLDLSSAELEVVELRGLRIDYLSLAQAKARDVLVADCQITTIDLPGATLTRVRFDDCRADEVDTRGLRAAHLDLRGLDALGFTDPGALRSATMTALQVEQHAAAFAAALGIHVG